MKSYEFIKHEIPLRTEQYKGHTVHFTRVISKIRGLTFIPQIIAYINKEEPFEKAWVKSSPQTSKYKAFKDIKNKIDEL